MPRGDKSGPSGMGSMTGRGAGFCTGNNQPGFNTSGGGRGLAQGRGMGRGMHKGCGCGGGRRFNAAPVYYNAPNKDQELASLKSQANAYEQGLKDIQKRIEELGD